MHEIIHTIRGLGLGTEHALTVLAFGDDGARPWVHVQGGLHADEGPGMIAARALCDLLEGETVTGRVTVLPVANPIGLGQTVLGHGIGRFDLADGANFNRGYPDLAPDAMARIGTLGTDVAANVALIREALAAALDARPAPTPADRLRQTLMRLALGADMVLDLHCDGEAAVHVYTQAAHMEVFAPLAAHLGARAVLLADVSGGNPFDEAVSRPWADLAAAFPEAAIPRALASLTVELRGQRDVDRQTAAVDAAAIVAFLRHAGVLGGTVAPVPAALCQPTPLAGSEPVVAPVAGLVSFRADVGDTLQAGDAVADVVDPVSGTVTTVRAPTGGVFFARTEQRIVQAGGRLGKVAGTEARRAGLLLGA